MKFSGRIVKVIIGLGICRAGSSQAGISSLLGDSLAAYGFYQPALKEYQRSLFNQEPDSLRVCLRIGDTYRHLGQMTKAQLWYEKVMDRASDSMLCVATGLHLAKLALQEHKPLLARFELDELSSFRPDLRQREQAELIRAVSFLDEGKSDSTLLYLEKVNTVSTYHAAANRIADRVRQYQQASLKNPGTAMILSSLVPGAGLFYAGDLKTGIKSLVLNGALGGFIAYSAYTAYQGRQQGDRQQYRIAVMDGTVVFSGLFLRYYHAGRRRAYNLARQYNQKRQQRLLNEVTAIMDSKPK